MLGFAPLAAGPLADDAASPFVDVSVAINATSSVTVAAQVIKNIASTVSSTSSVTVNLNTLKNIAVNISVTSTVTIGGNSLLDASCVITSTSSTAVDIYKINPISVTISPECVITCAMDYKWKDVEPDTETWTEAA